MREVLGAGRGVQAGEVEIPAMAAEARDAAGRESNEERGERRMRRGTRLQHNISLLSRKALSFGPRSFLPIKLCAMHNLVFLKDYSQRGDTNMPARPESGALRGG
jgi:hypothetical protein